MSDRDAIPGWNPGGQAPTPGPVSGWVSPAMAADLPSRSIFDRLAEAARIYRSELRRVVGLAFLFQGILSIPLAIFSALQVRLALTIWSDLFSSRYLTSLQPENLVVGPFDNVALNEGLMGVTIGLSSLGAMLAMGSIAAAVLNPALAGRNAVDVARTIVPRGGSILVAGSLITLAAGLFYSAQGFWLGRFSGLDTFGASTFEDYRRASDLAILFGVGALVAEVVLVYAIVRWSVAIPAYFVEGTSLRAALRRSSELTRGRRLSIFWLLAVVGLLVAFGASVLVYVPVVIVAAVGLGDVAMAVVVVLALAATLALWPPFISILVSMLYRDLRVWSSPHREPDAQAV